MTIWDQFFRLFSPELREPSTLDFMTFDHDGWRMDWAGWWSTPEGAKQLKKQLDAANRIPLSTQHGQ